MDTYPQNHSSSSGEPSGPENQDTSFHGPVSADNEDRNSGYPSQLIEALQKKFPRKYGVKRRNQGIPILLAHVSDDGVNMIVWCPFCARHHYHGTCGDPTGKAGEGHRTAHCYNDESPFRRTGYIVRLDKDWVRMKKAWQRKAR